MLVLLACVLTGYSTYLLPDYQLDLAWVYKPFLHPLLFAVPVAVAMYRKTERLNEILGFALMIVFSILSEMFGHYLWQQHTGIYYDPVAPAVSAVTASFNIVVAVVICFFVRGLFRRKRERWKR